RPDTFARTRRFTSPTSSYGKEHAALTPPRPTRPPPPAGATLASSVAIVSVVWFTNTSWRRDRISEPCTLRDEWIDLGGARAGSLIERRGHVPSTGHRR